jgi:hypothetical protein
MIRRVFLAFLVFNFWNAMNYAKPPIVFPRSANLYWNDSKEPHRRPGLGGLSKPPVPVRFAHLGGLGSSVGTSGLDTTFSSIPGEARVLLSSPRTPSATETGSQCEIKTLTKRTGCGVDSYTPRKFRAALHCARAIEEQPKKTPLLQLANEGKEWLKIS